jgi:hypothetical protein
MADDAGGPGVAGTAVARGSLRRLFGSSLDWETQMPELAQASLRYRSDVDLRGLRYSLRQVFRLLRDADDDRQEFVRHVRTEIRTPIRDEVARQMRSRELATSYFEAHGGLERMAEDRTSEVARLYAAWLDEQLQPWMSAIYPVLDEEVWLGAPDQESGVIDLLLFADAVGVNAYSWNMEIGDSPFRRLDMALRMDPPMVVLSDLYATSVAIA